MTDKPSPTPNAEDQDGPYFDPWEALGIGCASYNSQLDTDALTVLRGIRDGKYCTDIADEAKLSPVYVELLQSIFCTADWTEYGTSPRGCFPMPGGDFDGLIAAWEAYYQRRWGE